MVLVDPRVKDLETWASRQARPASCHRLVVDEGDQLAEEQDRSSGRMVWNRCSRTRATIMGVKAVLSITLALLANGQASRRAATACWGFERS